MESSRAWTFLMNRELPSEAFKKVSSNLTVDNVNAEYKGKTFFDAATKAD